MSDIVYTFDHSDPRARVVWDGNTYRASHIRRDAHHGLSVDLIRQTRRGGRDFSPKAGNGFVWLTLVNSLDRFNFDPDNTASALAAYVREIVAALETLSAPVPSTCGRPWVAEIELCPRCGLGAAVHPRRGE